MIASNSVSISVSLDANAAQAELSKLMSQFEGFRDAVEGARKQFSTFTRALSNDARMKKLQDATQRIVSTMTAFTGSVSSSTQAWQTFSTAAAKYSQATITHLEELRKEAKALKDQMAGLSNVKLPKQSRQGQGGGAIAGGGILPNPTRATGQFMEFNRTVGIGRDLLAGLGVAFSAYAITNEVRTAISSFVQFEKKFREVNTILRLSGREFQRMNDSVLLLGINLGKSPIELAAAQYNIASAGFTSASDSLTMLEQSTRLGVAGVATTEQAFLALNAVMQPFQIGVEDAEIAASKLFKTVELGLTTIPQLSSNLNKVAQNARNSGVTMEETLASISTITAVTSATTDVATTSIRALFNEINSKAATAAAASEKYASLGVNLSQFFGGDAVKNSGSLIVNIEGIVTELNKLDATSRSSTLAQLFGIEAQTAFLTLANNVNRFNRDLGQIAGATIEAKLAFDEMNKSAFRAIEQMTASAEVARNIFGEQLIRQVQGLGVSANEAGSAFMGIAESASYISGVLIPIAKAIANLVSSVVLLQTILVPIISDGISFVWTSIQVLVKDAENLVLYTINSIIQKSPKLAQLFGVGAEEVYANEYRIRQNKEQIKAIEEQRLASKKSNDIIFKDLLKQSIDSFVAIGNVGTEIEQNIQRTTARFAELRGAQNKVIETQKQLIAETKKMEESAGGGLDFVLSVDQQKFIEEYNKVVMQSEAFAYEQRIAAAEKFFAAQESAAIASYSSIFSNLTEEQKKQAITLEDFINAQSAIREQSLLEFEKQITDKRKRDIEEMSQIERRAFEQRLSAQQEYYQFIAASDMASLDDRMAAINSLAKTEKDRLEEQFADGLISAQQLDTAKRILDENRALNLQELNIKVYGQEKALIDEINRLKMNEPSTSGGDRLAIIRQEAEYEIAEYRRKAAIIGASEEQVREFERLKRLELERAVGDERINQMQKANLLYRTQIGEQLAQIRVNPTQGTEDLLSTEAVNALNSAFSTLKGTMTSAFSDAISGAKNFQEIMQDVGKAIIQVIIQIIAQILTAIAVALVLNALTGFLPALSSGAGAGASGAQTGANIGGAINAGGQGPSPFQKFTPRSEPATMLTPERPNSSFSYQQSNVTINAVDARSLTELFDSNPEAIRGAMSVNLNSSPSVQRAAGLI
jgi:TP901 family phage tail tape measure protein